jgi:hypothetical protein
MVTKAAEKEGRKEGRKEGQWVLLLCCSCMVYKRLYIILNS